MKEIVKIDSRSRASWTAGCSRNGSSEWLKVWLCIATTFICVAFAKENPSASVLPFSVSVQHGL